MIELRLGDNSDDVEINILDISQLDTGGRLILEDNIFYIHGFKGNTTEGFKFTVSSANEKPYILCPEDIAVQPAYRIRTFDTSNRRCYNAESIIYSNNRWRVI